MAWNDPQWGNNGNRNKNSGPPDLDEIWRRINQRLNSMFGGKEGGDGGEGGGGGLSTGGMPSGGLVGLLIGALAL
ncbi:MAG: protease modulator HflK, partial [Betaproteobacteria bacterium HGW-Betaproteobacteria-17]